MIDGESANTRMGKILLSVRERMPDMFSDEYIERNYDEFAKVCVSMDALEDTQVALEDYFKYGLGRNLGEQYIRFYGVLQTVVIQQDALRTLFLVVMGKELPRFKEESGWQKARDLRIRTAGHPVEHGGRRGNPVRRTFLVRMSLAGRNIDTIYKNTETCEDEFGSHCLEEYLANYLREAVPILMKIERNQRKLG